MTTIDTTTVDLNELGNLADDLSKIATEASGYDKWASTTLMMAVSALRSYERFREYMADEQKYTEVLTEDTQYLWKELRNLIEIGNTLASYVEDWADDEQTETLGKWDESIRRFYMTV
jgi:hypothetical protein